MLELMPARECWRAGELRVDLWDEARRISIHVRAVLPLVTTCKD